MDFNELLLQTAFCSMSCDGNIAEEELILVKQFASSSTLFEGLEIEKQLNEYVAEINVQGLSFLAGYINSIVNAQLTEQQELDLAKIAIKMIEADKKIDYSEISFFKRIRSKLRVSDDKLLEIFKDETLFDKFPEVQPEDFLLPDIIVDDDVNWSVSFENIKLTIEAS